MKDNSKNILVTGGAGFIGSTLIIKLLELDGYKVFNLDKISYASDTKAIDIFLKSNQKKSTFYELIKADLCDKPKLKSIINYVKPNFIFNLAAETHVDRSIDSPRIFLESNVVGTFNLLEETYEYWRNLNLQEKLNFKFIHISTDEVFGALGMRGSFNELTRYSPTSPYSASKASSDHFVNAWHHTYDLPINIANCSNNFGPWQYPEKFIPIVINKALSNQDIPIYGDGSNVRDWLYVEDHADALILIMEKGRNGSSYCIGGEEESTNLELVNKICNILDKLKPNNISYKSLISFVKDRPGHDFRYSIDSSKIREELGWEPKFNLENALIKTVEWYVNNRNWSQKIITDSGYDGGRLGLNSVPK